jgi:putative tricarboxylic transport membrane protein
MSSHLKKSKIQDGLFLIVLSGLVIKESFTYHRFGSWALSPALIPIGISCILIFLALAMMISSIGEDQDSNPFSPAALKNPALVFILTVVYLLILSSMHFLIATCAYLVAMMLILGERKPVVIGLISIGIPMLLYGLFDILLSVRLP